MTSLLKTTIAATSLGLLMSTPLLAAGDAAKGEKLFSQCQTCHVVVDGDGAVLAGRNAKTGPNLYGVIGRAAGSVEGFKYGDSIVELGATGFVWDEATLATYVQDPTAFLKEALGDSKARGKMSFKVRKEADAADLAAFLATFSPEAAPATN
jgi:cytochrome c